MKTSFLRSITRRMLQSAYALPYARYSPSSGEMLGFILTTLRTFRQDLSPFSCVGTIANLQSSSLKCGMIKMFQAAGDCWAVFFSPRNRAYGRCWCYFLRIFNESYWSNVTSVFLFFKDSTNQNAQIEHFLTAVRKAGVRHLGRSRTTFLFFF